MFDILTSKSSVILLNYSESTTERGYRTM